MAVLLAQAIYEKVKEQYMLKHLPLITLSNTELIQVDGLQDFNFRQDTVESNRCDDGNKSRGELI